MIDFFTSQIFLTIFASWVTAKMIKTVLRVKDEVKKKDMLDAGGFPSEHTALIMSTFFATAFETNWDPVLSSITFFIAVLFMYDATHIRLQSEIHARILNKLSETKKMVKTPLEDSLGHTYLEVIGGALVALIVCLGSYYL